MLEIFTTGGGEYIVNVFNAVAAWTGGGGFRALLRVVMVVSFIYVLLVVAFSLDWRAWLKWFLGATLIYGVLIVPTTSVQVTDRLNPSLAPATVDNVPIGLAAVASVSSQAGDWLTQTAETVFVMPSSLQMSNNGIIYGARLWDRTQNFTIKDPRVRANLEEYFRSCLFYDIMLGHKSFDAIANSNDILTDMGPGSPARGMKYVNSSMAVSIVTCQQGYTNLQSGELDAAINSEMTRQAEQTFPGLTPAAARAKLDADIPAVASHFHGSGQTAKQIFQQRSLTDVFLEARSNLGGADGDTFAVLRAEEQARNTYTSISQQAMTWVPLLNIVLTVVFYAMFPVIFPLFLLPQTGPSAVKGYFTGFFYLAAWGPLYVVLHMFIMDRTADAMAAASPGGVTMAGLAGIDAVNADTATIAGFLMMSIPFLAAGMARGAMAVSSQATSMLAPAQSAAEAAAVEQTTGNYAYGSQSIMNSSMFNKQANQVNTAPNLMGGTGMSSFRNGNGTVTKTTGDGSTVYDTGPGMSRLASSFSLSQFAQAERSETFTELESARSSLSAERAELQSFVERASSRSTVGVRDVSGSERSSGNRAGTNLQRYDNQGQNSSDNVSASQRVSDTRGSEQQNTDRLETRQGGNIGLSGSAGRGNRGRGQSGGSGAGLNGGVEGSISGGRYRGDTVSRGERFDEAQGFDSSTGQSQSNGSIATSDNGTFSQDSTFDRSEGYSDRSYTVEQARDRIQQISDRIAEIDEVSSSLGFGTSAREGMGANANFDMSQIVAARYEQKAAELGISAPSLARTDYSPGEQAAYEMVAREIISDYYDERVEPVLADIPERGSLVGNVSGPSDFDETSLGRPSRGVGGPRRLSSGAGDTGAVEDRIDAGSEGLDDRYRANSDRYAERREDFNEDRQGDGGAEDRFNEQFYNREERERGWLHKKLRGE